MNFSSRSQKLWPAVILALVVFLLLCNIRPEQDEHTLHNKDTKADHGTWKDVWEAMPERLKHTLHKRGDKQGNDDGHGVDNFGDHTSFDNAWGTLPVNNGEDDKREPGERMIPGPKTEPPLEPCNRKDWVFWLSFGAPHWEFEWHRKTRDISCLKKADWKSDACTGFIDKPGIPGLWGPFDFKIGCQRRDFARRNLREFRVGFREDLTGSMTSFEPFIKARFAKDIWHMCGKPHPVSLLKDAPNSLMETEAKKICKNLARFYVSWDKS